MVIKMNKLYYVFDIATPLHFVYCGKASFQTNYIHDRRIMKDYEIFIVTSGKLYMEQNNYQAEITPKQICFNLPHIVHQGYKRYPSDFYWLHFTSKSDPVLMTHEEIEASLKTDPNYFNKKMIMPRHFSLTNFEALISLASWLLQSVLTHRNQDYEDYFITLICTEITKQVLSTFEYYETSLPIRLNMIIEDIKNNINNKITVKSISEKFNYSEKYLSYLFKKHLGVTPHKFIISQKIEHSKNLLHWTDNSIKDIAFFLGFEDEHHFMRIFKSYVGVTASAYRKSFSKA